MFRWHVGDFEVDEVEKLKRNSKKKTDRSQRTGHASIVLTCNTTDRNTCVGNVLCALNHVSSATSAKHKRTTAVNTIAVHGHVTMNAVRGLSSL